MEKNVKGRGLSPNRKFWLGVLSNEEPGKFLEVRSFDTIKKLVDYVVTCEGLGLYLPYTNLSTSITRKASCFERYSLVWVDRKQGLLVWVEYLDYKFK